MNAPADRALGRIVIVDDDPFLVEQLTWALKGRFVVTSARDATQGRALCGPEADLYLFDLRLPPSNEVREGLDLLRHARRLDPEATVVMMSGEGERAHALEAIALGAFDFFQKPVDPAELVVILERAVERRRLVAENRELRREAAAAHGPAQLIGRSPAFRRMLKEIEKVAASDATVLIQGESGSGKELVARSLHAGSPRRDRAFVAVNVAALPESLAESELFGHEKGAFTGAVASRPGRFELAQGGTLFLDEIGTLSAATQSKLLRAIESREIERVGGRRAIPVDFRLLSATNENLEARVAAGSFREDLFYRINTIPIAVPPLRERPGDLAMLAEHFLAKFSAREGKKTRRLAPGGPRAARGASLEGQRAGARARHRNARPVLGRRRDRPGGPAARAARRPDRGRGRRAAQTVRRGGRGLRAQAPVGRDRRRGRREGRSRAKARPRRKPDQVPVQEIRSLVRS